MFLTCEYLNSREVALATRSRCREFIELPNKYYDVDMLHARFVISNSSNNLGLGAFY
jgi:hypothetical protein